MAGPASVITRRRGSNSARRWIAQRELRRHEETVTYVLLMLCTAMAGLAVWRWPAQVPPLVLAPFVLLGALWLTLRQLTHLYALTGVILMLDGYVRERWLVIVAALALMAILYVVASSRARLGIRGLTGENLLVDLRDRLERTALIPDLPAPWQAEYAISAANGEGFAGDFLVSTLSLDGTELEVALVDVSGKGREAGSRSLHLSGAFSGLIGSVPGDTFLARANHYLLRQRWDEGFATAVHLSLNLSTGRYAVSRAGHPPSATFTSSTTRWHLDGTLPGPLLGIFEEGVFPLGEGVLDIGDGLLLYSDGVVESPGHDLIDGLDRMLGQASRVLVAQGGGVAQAVVSGARSGMSDDRAAFFIRRC